LEPAATAAPALEARAAAAVLEPTTALLESSALRAASAELIGTRAVADTTERTAR
jgi:hypothetical protein